MRAEEELKTPHSINKRIRVQLARIDQIRLSLLPGGMNYDLDRVQGGFPGDRYAEAMGRISEIEERIKKLEEKKRYYETERIPLLLSQVFKPDAVSVLELHILQRMSMQRTADALYMSRSTANRLMKDGLKDIQGYLEKEKR